MFNDVVPLFYAIFILKNGKIPSAKSSQNHVAYLFADEVLIDNWFCFCWKHRQILFIIVLYRKPAIFLRSIIYFAIELLSYKLGQNEGRVKLKLRILEEVKRIFLFHCFLKLSCRSSIKIYIVKHRYLW